MSRYWSPFVHNLKPYVPGEQPSGTGLVKLNTNENPYGPSEQVLAAIAEAGANGALRLYPDPESRALRHGLASYLGVNADQIFVGNGSDEVLAHAFHGLLKHDAPLLLPDISYDFYRVYCELYGIPCRMIAVGSDFSILPDDYIAPCGGIVLANPNAPTGRLLCRSDIESLLSRHRDRVVVVDEAYVDFGGESAVPLISLHPNLLVVQTFSKSRSLAGLRVGYAVGQAHLIEGLQRVKNSFNSYPLGRPAVAGAMASLADETHFRKCCDLVMASRERLQRDLTSRGFDVVPSAANFLFVRHPDHDAATLAASLRERSVIVRHFVKPRIAQHLRITVGTEEQNNALLAALDSSLAA